MVVIPYTWLEGISPTSNLSVRFVQVNSFTLPPLVQHTTNLTVRFVQLAEHDSPYIHASQSLKGGGGQSQ